MRFLFALFAAVSVLATPCLAAGIAPGSPNDQIVGCQSRHKLARFTAARERDDKYTQERMLANDDCIRVDGIDYIMTEHGPVVSKIRTVVRNQYWDLYVETRAFNN